MKATKPHIVVLGAGPAGLGAAHQLAKRDLARVTVLEQHHTVGGNAGSFEHEGLFLDYGSHRLHPASNPLLLEELKQLLGDQLLTRPRHGRIRLQGRWIHFPLKPLDLLTKLSPAFALGIAGDALAKMWPKRNKNSNFATVLKNQLGNTICREFYFPYARKIWGLAPEHISPIQAYKRVSANSFAKIIKKVLSGVGKESPIFYYPKQGFGQISTAIYQGALAAGAQVHLGTKVLELHQHNNRVESVTFENQQGRQTLAADYIWSTIPISILLRCLQPQPRPAVLQAAASIHLRAMLLVYLVLGQDQFSQFDAHYFPGADIPLTRLSESKNYSASTRPKGLTAICAELPCATSDPVWSQGDRELAQIVEASLQRAGIPITAPVRQVIVRRIPHAYPIYNTGFEQHFALTDAYVDQIDRLLTFGRQGLFVHDNTHHALYMAYAAVDCIDDQGGFDKDQWQQYRQEFEDHIVED